jgi:hypothetical protein
MTGLPLPIPFHNTGTSFGSLGSETLFYGTQGFIMKSTFGPIPEPENET